MIGGDEAGLSRRHSGLRRRSASHAGLDSRRTNGTSGTTRIEIARYEVPEAGTHNIWIDEENEIMYVAYYQGGLRDRRHLRRVSWRSLSPGARDRRTSLHYDPEGYMPNSPFVWGPQPFKGNIFFSDYNSGLWAVRLKPRDGEPTADNQN